MDRIKRRMDHWFFEESPTLAEVSDFLDESAARGDTEALKYLLNHSKTQPYLKSLGYRDHLLDIALYNYRLEAAKYLVSIGAKSSIGQLPIYKDFDILRLALENVNPPKDENQRRILADSFKYLRHGPKKREIKKKMLKTASAAKSFLDYSKGEIGGAVWSETMGDFYRIMGRPPFDSHTDCMSKTYMDKNDMKKTYTKEQLYFMAKGMGLSVKRDMNKDELCTIIVYSK